MRYLAILSTFAVGLACGVLGSMLVAQYQTGLVTANPGTVDSWTVDPGTEVISILEDVVMSVGFRTDKMAFTAQRSKPGAVFAVQVTYADGRAIQQCQASPDLGGRLALYSTITAKRQLQSQQQAEKDFPVPLGILELPAPIKNDPNTEIRLRASSDRKALAALFEGVAVEVTNPESAFTSLENACHFLNGQVAPR